ncbi:MAG: hypothetical protein RIC55_30095 [Pirellulaceae bacterium]
MSSRVQQLAFFLLGGVFSTAAFVLLGAAGDPAAAPRYDADFDTILGGIGGMVIEVTDHQEQESYLYASVPDPEKKNQAPEFQLVGAIDLTSSGEPKLKTQWTVEKPAKAKE